MAKKPVKKTVKPGQPGKPGPAYDAGRAYAELGKVLKATFQRMAQQKGR